MELFLKNVGIVKEANILLDGLTVITGKNSSGKTTVGKVVYSLLAAGSEPTDAFEKATKSYVCAKLNEVEKTLEFRRTRRMHYSYTQDKEGYDRIIRILSTHSFVRYEIDKLIGFLIETRNFIEELSLDDYKKYLSFEDVSTVASRNYLETLLEGFYERKEAALQICKNALGMIESSNAFTAFLQDRTAAYLNHEFNDQIKPVRAKSATASISLTNNGKTLVAAKVKSKDWVEFSQDSAFIYPYEKCIFIDNPFVLDRLDEYEEEQNSLYHGLIFENESESLITSKDIETHDDILISQLMQKERTNFFTNLEIQEKYSAVFEKINKIVPGEFVKSSKGVFYSAEGTKLSIKNLATGSKMFFIIKKLLLNGFLDDKTMLVLDEPESHLHPDWINKFAEILVVLIKDIGVNVLLTTHSPNLLLALNVHARKMDVSTKSHFYLAEEITGEHYSQIRCIDESIGEGYSHLSLPLVEMNVYWEALNS